MTPQGEDHGNPRRDEIDADDVLEALPGIARLAADAWLRAALWSLGAGVRVGTRVARAAVDPRYAAELVQDVGTGMRGYAREFLGISDLDERVKQLTAGGARF